MCFVGCHKESTVALSYDAIVNWICTSMSDENLVIDLIQMQESGVSILFFQQKPKLSCILAEVS